MGAGQDTPRRLHLSRDLMKLWRELECYLREEDSKPREQQVQRS